MGQRELSSDELLDLIENAPNGHERLMELASDLLDGRVSAANECGSGYVLETEPEEDQEDGPRP